MKMFTDTIDLIVLIKEKLILAPKQYPYQIKILLRKIYLRDHTYHSIFIYHHYHVDDE